MNRCAVDADAQTEMVRPAERSGALVVYGITGHLVYKQIFPALQGMIRHRHLDAPVTGVGRSRWSLEQLRARARASVEQHDRVDSGAVAKLSSLLRYVNGDYGDTGTFEQLRQELGAAERPVHYLAIPPTLFEKVASGLAHSGLANAARVMVDKPFGRDLAPSREWNETLRRYFDEPSIFRIDHYLGKEPVQNLLSSGSPTRILTAGARMGVPFLIRTGKRLRATAIEVTVTLKRPPATAFGPLAGYESQPLPVLSRSRRRHPAQPARQGPRTGDARRAGWSSWRVKCTMTR